MSSARVVLGWLLVVGCNSPGATSPDAAGQPDGAIAGDAAPDAAVVVPCGTPVE
nr:hypothetical protein [Deltaproteobacteria bacterium]